MTTPDIHPSQIRVDNCEGEQFPLAFARLALCRRVDLDDPWFSEEQDISWDRVHTALAAWRADDSREAQTRRGLWTLLAALGVIAAALAIAVVVA